MGATVKYFNAAYGNTGWLNDSSISWMSEENQNQEMGGVTLAEDIG